MGYLLLIAMLTALITISYFIIKDGNKQLNDDEDDDPTITCWDDDKVHTEGNF